MKTGLQTKAVRICSLMLIALLLCALLPTLAQADDEIRCYADTTWSVTNSGSTFTVTRSGDLSRTETVYYRTVSLSAVEGQHFTKKTGTLVFGENEDSKTVTVTESNNPTGAYQYQIGATRTYRFEVCDPGGFYLASVDRTITKGTSVSKNALRWISVNVAAGPITVTDDGYAQAYHTVPINNYFSQAPKAYLQMIGIREIRMYLDFEAAEKEDGYQYIQIYVNDTTNVDTGAGSGLPGTVSNSVYAAGFGHDPGEKNTTFYRYCFPVASVENGSGADTPWTDLSNTVGKLYQQTFNTARRTEDGYVKLCRENSSSVNTLAQLDTVGIRLNASGNNSDTWYAKTIKANFKAIDASLPQPDTSNIVVAPGPGSGGHYRKDNLVYVTVPFNEIVVSQGQPFLETTWGSLAYEAGLGTNVLTFKGKAPSGNSGTNVLKVTGISSNSLDIKDLADNVLTKKIQWDGNNTAPAADYSYTVEYELGGGESPSGQVTSYTYVRAAFTLQEPYWLGYDFTGWTGTNGSTPQTTVTVATHSHGDRRYVANWSETSVWGMDDDADGSEEYPYLIRTPEELIALRDWVNRGSDFAGTYFKLCNDLNMNDVNFDTIGYDGKPFKGKFDGCGYTIRNLNASLGLFGRIENGAISNLTLDHAAVYKTGGNVGALVGFAKDAAINNCVVKDSTVGSNQNCVGGFVGYAIDATVDNCVVANTTVTGSKKQVGGFVGYTTGAAISNCVVADSTVSGADYVGGFCGYQYSGSTDCFVLRTSVTATGSNSIGAVVGMRIGTFYPYNYNCTVNGAAPAGNTANYTVYTVTAGEHITVSGTVNKTYENVDYYKKNNEITLTYTGEIPAGYELAYTVNGEPIEGNTFSITSDSEVAALRKLLTHPDITITVPAQTATGSALTPEITVMDGETVLTEGTDYTVGDWSGALIEPGRYTATLTGVGSYAGTATATFRIKAPGSDIVRVDTVDYDDLAEAHAAWTGGTTMTLLADVTLAADTTLEVSAQNVTLDLNGHRLTGADGKPTVKVNGGSLTLLDSIGGGTITHAEGATGYGMYVYGGKNDNNKGVTSSVTMESGTISGNAGTGNYGGGVYVFQWGGSATFTMNGGSITGNTAAKEGGGVKIYGGTFTMNGGSITGNTAGDLGGGIYADKNVGFSGSVTVTGNRGGVAADGTGGRTDNVYLYKVKIRIPSGKTLDAAARIGVTLSYGEGEFTYYVQQGMATAENFTSDDENYIVVMKDNGVLELRRTYAVTIAESAAGAVTASVGGQPVTRALEGAAVVLTVSPDMADLLESLSYTYTPDGGTETTVPVAAVDGVYSFSMPAADVTVSAVFRLADGFYLIGQNGWTADDIDPAQKFAVNPENNSEYLLTTTLQPNDQFKVVRVANGAIAQWYPDPADNYGQNNNDNNHVITTAGTYTICFRPDGQGGNDWYAHTLYVFRSWKFPSFEKQSLVLNELIGVRFKLQLPKTDNERVSYADSYMEFAITGRGADTLETTRIDYDDTDPSETATFLCRVNALQMAETITATFHFKLDGEDRTIEKTYSVKEYIEAWDAAVQNGTTGIDDETQRNKTNALVHALADYGHYVQPFLAWANNFTIGTDYAEMTKFYTDAYGVAAIKEAAGAYGKTVEGSTAFKSPSMSLVLDSETAIRVFLAHADSTKLNLADVQITVSPEAGVDWNAATQMTKTQAGNRIMVEIKGVKAAWLCKNFTVTVTENTESGEQSQTVTLSALSYVAPFLTAYDGNATAQNAICALYQYAQAAQ